MLFGLGHSLSDRLQDDPRSAGLQQVRRIEGYIEAHAEEPIDMQRLSMLTGQSASALQRAFRRHRGQSPIAHLRDLRLRLARCYLLQGRTTDSITQIALRCGFPHLGRFAAMYKGQFGETPSETHRRARQGSSTR